MQVAGTARLRQAHRGWGTSGGLQGRSPGPAKGQTGVTTVLPAGSQVGCSSAVVLPSNILAAVAPICTGSTNESAVFSPGVG